MHEHDRYTALISAVLDGEAAPAEAAELMDHLADCPACQAAYDQMLAMQDAFSRWEEPELPGDLTAAVMDRVRQERRRPFKRRSLPSGLRRFAAAAACLALILLGARLLPPQSASSPEAPPPAPLSIMPAATHNVEPRLGSTAAPQSLEPEIENSQPEETDQTLDSAVTYFNSLPVQKSDSSKRNTSGDDAPQAVPLGVTTLTSSDPELLRWMSANTAVSSCAKVLPDTGEATVWLVSAEEYRALTDHLSVAQVEVTVEYAEPVSSADQGEEVSQAVYCVVYVQEEE